MDANKLKKLKSVNYEIKPCCGLCKHATLSTDGWGTCYKHVYAHEKHSHEFRHLSINRAGICDSFEQNEVETIMLLGAFKQFVKQE